MTAAQFRIECNYRLIDPGIALENDAIVKALQDKDDKKVIELLDTEF